MTTQEASRAVKAKKVMGLYVPKQGSELTELEAWRFYNNIHVEVANGRDVRDQLNLVTFS